MRPSHKYVGRTFHGQSDSGKLLGQRLLEDMTFERCYFQGEALSLVKRPAKRTIVRNIVIENCEAVGCIIGPAVLDTVRVRDLKTNALLQVWQAAFRRVKLEGRMPSLMVSPDFFDVTHVGTPIQKAFDDANERFYETVDWALDITEAEFPDVELRGIPARLVRADPDISVVVTREQAKVTDAWRSEWVDLELRVGIERLLDSPCEDVVMVAATGHPRYGQLRAGLKRLLDMGVAEPLAPMCSAKTRSDGST
jgi:hypothetical protein